jgi:hypothetical protein
MGFAHVSRLSYLESVIALACLVNIRPPRTLSQVDEVGRPKISYRQSVSAKTTGTLYIP